MMRAYLLPMTLGVLAPAAAAAQGGPTLVYPAMREGGVAYAVEAGEDRRITGCRPVDPAASAQGCASLVARARFTPATYKGQAVPAAGIR